MQNVLAWTVVVCCLFTSCKTDVTADPLFVNLELEVSQLKKENQALKDSISLLNYSLEDRLSDIKSLIAKDFLQEALIEIDNLSDAFPLSEEAKEAQIQKEIVLGIVDEKLEKAIRLRNAGFTSSYEAYIPAFDNPRLERLVELFLEIKVSSLPSIITILDFVNQEIGKHTRYSDKED